MEVDLIDDIKDEIVEVSLEDTIRDAMRVDNNDNTPAIASKPDATRDESGKFAAKQPETTSKRDTLSLPEKTGEVNAAVAPSVSENAIASAPTVKPPSGWNTQMREKFSTLPPEVQSYISQRDSEIEKKITSQDEDRLLGKKVNEMANPYLPTIRAEGATVEKAFQDYLQTAHVLRQGTDFQKAQSIAAVMQQFKVSPQALLSILQGSNVVQGNTSQLGMHNPAIETLQQRIDRLEAEQQAVVQQRQAQEQHSLQSQIEDFAAKPGHEHFETVRNLMGTLLESGQAADLDDAYDRAIYATPEIRSSLVTANQRAEQDKRLTEQQARTEAARRAGGSVSGGPGAARAMNGSGANVPIEETIRAALRESQGRV